MNETQLQNTSRLNELDKRQLFRLLGVLKLNQSFEMRLVLFRMDLVQHVATSQYTLPVGRLPHMRTHNGIILIFKPLHLFTVRQCPEFYIRLFIQPNWTIRCGLCFSIIAELSRWTHIFHLEYFAKQIE